ncbi:unnamed protein product [Musa acuminata subsp. malaccensis]|uniref:(wild Malaysian banana) hypothetical protein n=1 Tax=Musa acuminata subsp. malaccensis TaxID=214687 RepID=A0A804JCP2_MUSAM|nr:PREDICTED: uncharacterized protein LOC103986834 [Musa acuminata subsp. malaccensis]XP_009403222.1 PREDICTED: uncharacterized protein LOC103986834 [Musa acuminata subsp. malaccensis]CAG1845297.1 unnamed protein product [Musa acuminata subsp. malaccensis]
MKVFGRNLELDHERAMISWSPFLIALLLLMSIPVVFVLAPRILPPKTMPSIPDLDEVDDLALFRRATLASAGGEGGRGGAGIRRRAASAPKIAFLFLTNSDLVFAPLWERFFHGHERLFNVYVHADPAAELLLPPTPSFRGRFIPAKATQRSSPTLISAARRLLAAALIDDPANAFYALLSQSCVPLHSFRFAYHAILADPGTPSNLPDGRRRRRSYIEISSKDPWMWNRYVARGDGVMMPEVPFEKFRAGSQFFVLARRHAVMVVRDRRFWKKFKMPCLKSRVDSCYPEEHYFPTLLDMQDPAGCTRYTLTRVNWTDSVGGHPHMYQPPEISANLINELRKSNSTYSHLFARKFSAECLDPLLELADSVIFQD